MKYISTRGGMAPMGFRRAVMTGMAEDGGLLLPRHIPDATPKLSAWRALAYPDLAFEVMALYADLPSADLRDIVRRSTAAFRHDPIAPVTKAGPVFLLELFHGPTLAFKDIALQFLGRLFEHFMTPSDPWLNILGATSGDTGSAAIHGVRGRERIRIFVMHPQGRVSPTQKRQMTTVLDDNVFNIALEGTFDDCQRIMKALFADVPFKRRHALGSVNSINWARVLAQMVYYFHAAFRVMDRTGADRVRFAVPTGNFGDILAGFLAARMGLPIDRLVLATNENDVLTRFFHSGEYRSTAVVPSLSPSMDIQVASNFERYLYYRLDEDAAAVTRLMDAFARSGRLCVAPLPDGRMDDRIVAGAADSRETLRAIRAYYEQWDCLVDPHTAAGLAVAERHLDDAAPMICLATAHPAKFGEAIERALGENIARHPVIDRLDKLPERCDRLPATESAVRAYIAERT